jgi:hypothetical protein
MNNFGFLGLDGQRVVVKVRRHLGLPYVQQALRTAAETPGAWLPCCCGGGRMRPFLIPGFPQPVFDVRRESAADRHADGCFAGQLGLFLERPPVTYALSAFEAPAPRLSPGVNQLPATSQGRGRFGSFTHFCYTLLGRASMRAFLAANHGKTYRDRNLHSFSVAEFDAAIYDHLTATTLSRGQRLVPTLHAAGSRIFWGITSKALGESLIQAQSRGRDLRLVLHDVHSSAGNRHAELCLRVPYLVAASAGGRRTGFKDLIKPPYWFMVTMGSQPTREGSLEVYVATRAVVLPVASESGVYVIESEFERLVLLERLRQGVALLKPATHYELGELGPEFWPFGLLGSGHLPHRPDLITFEQGGCWLTELAGLDDDPAYLSLVDQRLTAMAKITTHPDVRTNLILRRSFLASQAGRSN